MLRPHRVAPGGLPFHVLNRAVGRRTIFESDADYAEFIDVVAEALRTRPMRICSYCVMPNHWHMVLACLGNPDPGDMKVYCPVGKETFDDDETTEEAPSRGDRCEAA